MQVSLAQTRERKCDSGAHAHPRRKVLLQVRVERAGHGGAYRLKNRSEHLIKLGFAITRYFQNIILYTVSDFCRIPPRRRTSYLHHWLKDLDCHSRVRISET